MSKNSESIPKRVDRVLGVSRGTMPIEMIASSEEEKEEIAKCLKGKRGSKLISIKIR